MSFSFGFSGDDIEDEGDVEEQDTLANGLSKYSISEPESSNSHLLPPKKHSLEELLASLPSQISYNALHIPSSGVNETTHNGASQQPSTSVKIYRRSLFDIRTQLMAESNPSATEADPAETLLAGLENGDLSSGIYEGGFKTWECALDLASLLVGELNPFADDSDTAQDWEIIELGAGSAIPSMAVLQSFLASGKQGHEREDTNLKVTLCDYNEDVLRLATAPNVFLNYLSSPAAEATPSLSSVLQEGGESDDEGDLDLEDLRGENPPLLTSTVNALLAAKISLTFISGGWGLDLIHLLSPSPSPDPSSSGASIPSNNKKKTTLILASETIYSPASIKPFSQTLIALLRSQASPGGGVAKASAGASAKAYIAAKKVYFGVGGGVDEFEREITALGGRCRVVLETKDTGVGRVVIEVTVAPV